MVEGMNPPAPPPLVNRLAQVAVCVSVRPSGVVLLPEFTHPFGGSVATKFTHPFGGSVAT